jgi:hypothetical protein
MTPLSSISNHELAQQIPPRVGDFTAPVTDDLLNYLPRVQPSRYVRGETLPQQAITYVETGMVHVAAILPGTGESAGLGFHGEGALLVGGRDVVITVLRNDTMIMGWNVVDIALHRNGAPRAYLDLLAAHVEHLHARLAESRLYLPQRLAVTLLRLAAGPLGEQASDGVVKLPALPQCELAREVNTTREIVTLHMRQWKNQRAVWYDRKGIAVYPERLREVAKLEGVTVHV